VLEYLVPANWLDEMSASLKGNRDGMMVTTYGSE
jgi:hypothetical protein